MNNVLRGVVVAMAALFAAIWSISDNGPFPIFRPAPPKALAASTAVAPTMAVAIPPEQPTSPTWGEMDKLNKRLEHHDRSVLSVIPAMGYRDGVAGVLRDNRLYVNANSEIYFRAVPLPDKNQPVGYYFSLFVCRVHKSNHYEILDGVHAVWFRVKDQSSFVPWNAWAQHVSDHDSWIRSGGPIDEMDSVQRGSRSPDQRPPEEAARAAAHAVFGR